jgi:putative hydrolase of the HAD superfamily
MTDTRIEAIVCDLGGVLTTPLLEAFVAFERQSGIPLAELGKAMAGVGERDGVNPLFELETGRISAERFQRSVAAQLTAELGREVSMDNFGEFYFKHLHPNQPMIDCMRELKQRGYRMAMCTNNVREWQPLWRPLLPVDEIFDHVIDSGFVGMRKPDAEIYELTLERVGVPAAAALLIDDIEINCTAARELGMRAVWFRTNEQALAEIEAAVAS